MAGARGEAYLTVDGERVGLLYTNRALARAEELLGKPIMQLLREAAGERLGIGETATLLQVGMDRARQEERPGSRPVTRKEADDVLDALGFVATAQAVYQAIAAVVTYQVNAEDDDNPPA